MEMILEQILGELKNVSIKIDKLEQGQTRLEQGQAKLEQRLTNVEQGQTKLEQRLTNVEQGQTKLEQRLTNVEQRITTIEQRLTTIEQGQARIEKKLDAVYEQTAFLTEYRTETTQNFQDVHDSLDFLYHKGVQNEKEIFAMKERKYMIK